MNELNFIMLLQYKNADKKTNKAKYGLVSNISESKRKEINSEFKKIIEKYIKISNNGYK